MALHLRFAPSADLLAQSLQPLLYSLWTDPFAPPRLLVPNPSVGRWLALRVADRACGGLGCQMGLERTTLERFLWDQLQPQGVRRLGADALAQVLCALLDEDFCARPGAEPLARYLLGADGRVDDLRRVQLSMRLGRQFQEYEFNRPSVFDPKNDRWRIQGLDATWLAGQSYCATLPGASAELLAAEAWQSMLYRDALGAIANHTDARLLSLPHLYRERRVQGLPDGSPWSVDPGPVLLFQVAKISHFHRNLLIEMADRPGVDLHVFLTNPCAEFWEDVDTRRHRRPRQRWHSRSAPAEAGVRSRAPEDYGRAHLGEIAPQPADPPLLALWGDTGKENIYLWCPASQWDFEYVAPPALDAEAPTSVLKALQFALLRRDSHLPPRTDGLPWCADASLQIVESPDRARAVDDLHARILSLAQDKAVVKLEDIVVYLCSPEEFLPDIQRVFGALAPGEPGAVPFTVLGVPGADSLFAQAVLGLLGLLGGRFDRAAVFAILRNPLVQATRKCQASQVAQWEEWAAELGIFRGFDAAHREAMGDQGPYVTEAHTFGLAFARLLAGSLATGEVDLGLGAPVPVFRDFASSESALLAAFVTIVEALYDDIGGVRKCLDDQGPVAAAGRLLELVWAWCGALPRDDGWNMAGEERVRREFVEAVPTLFLQESLCGRLRMSVDEFCDHIRGFLPTELPAASRAWVGGVTFAPLRSGLVLPHKAVFVLGLDAAAFPGTSLRPPSDLLGHRRIVGDPDPVRDNRFAFLELLHAATDRLVLYYRAADMQKEQELQPSGVILELESYLYDEGLAKGSLRLRLPWISWEDPAVQAGFDAEAAALAVLRYAPRRSRRTIDGLSGVSQSAQPIPESSAGAATGDGVLRASLREVSVFFRNPLEYHVRHGLGLGQDDDPGTASAVDEPLQSDSRAWSALQKEVGVAVLRAAFPLEAPSLVCDGAALRTIARDAAERLYGSYLLSGASPEGEFALNERAALERWADFCADMAAEWLSRYTDHCFLSDVGFAWNSESDAAAVLPVVLPNGREVHLQGKHAFVLAPRSGAGTMVLVAWPGGKVSDKIPDPDLWLAAVIQLLANAACTRVDAVLVSRRSFDWTVFAMADRRGEGLAPLRAWLAQLLDGMLVQRRSEHLPCTAVAAAWVGLAKSPDPWTELTPDLVQDELEGDYPAYRCFLDAFALLDAEIPTQWDNSSWRQLLHDRFAPYLEGWFHELA